MRIVLFAHGTRGDIWPVIALGAQLIQHDHDVTVATAEEFRGPVEHAAMTFGRLPVSLTGHLASDAGQELLNRGGVAVLRDIQRLYNQHADETDEAFERIGQGAEAIVANQFTWDRAQALGDAQRVPVAMVYPQPAVLTAAYGSPMLTSKPLRGAAVRRASHELTHWVWWRGARGTTAAFRERLGLHPHVAPAYRRHQHDGALGLCTWSPSLVPRPADFRPGIHHGGAWQLPSSVRTAAGEDVPADLAAWIDAGEPPVFLGFGSMPVLHPGPMLDDIAAVTRTLGIRAIINADWENRISLTLPDHLRLVGAVDHDLVLPLCIAAVHHGGCGTTAASTRAGCPTVVCSVWADQPWWGELLARRGVGAHLPFRKLDRPRLEAALRTVLQPEVRERASSLGDTMRAEGDGLPAAATALDDWLVTAEATPDGRAGRLPRRRRVAS